jgi:hypothetical protein
MMKMIHYYEKVRFTMKLQHCALLACLIMPAKTLSAYFPEVFKVAIKNGSLIYAGAMGSVIAHELGHALTAKALWGNPVDITIGISPEKDLKEKKAPIFKFLGMQFKSFNPIAGGFAQITGISGGSTVTIKSLCERIAILAAGPLAGSAFLGMLCKAFHIKPTYDSRGDLLGNMFNALILSQVYNLFFTADQLSGRDDSTFKSDGEHIYDALRLLWKMDSL